MLRSLFVLLVLFVFNNSLEAQGLKIHHINVGQGDCTLFVSPTGKTLLVDAGPNKMGTSSVLPYLQSIGVAKLDYVIATHYHADHIGGLDEVLTGLGAANIGTVYDRGTANAVPATAVYTNYASAADAALGGHHALTAGTTIDLGGGVSLTCLATDGTVLGYGLVSNATSSENDLSSAWLLSYNEFRYFTGGDCGGESSSYADLETPIATSSGVGAVDAFKVDHHGSTYSSNQTFVNTLHPTAAVIMVGNGNSYNHPVQAILDRLAAANCYTYLTEVGNGGTVPSGHGVVANGNIILSTTGHNSFTIACGTQTDTYALHQPSQSVISISLSPAASTLAPGAKLQFTATVTGSPNTQVDWKLSGGSIDASGLFTAPSTAGNYTVTATSSADSTKSASATVTVTAAPSAAFSEVEPNNTIAGANAVGAAVNRIVGAFPSAADTDDNFAVTLLAGHTLTVDMTGATTSGLDYDLYLTSSAGTKLAASENAGTTEHVSYRNTNASAAKTIIINVHRYAGCSATPYSLSFTR